MSGHSHAIVELPVSWVKISRDVPSSKEGADPETGVVPGEELQGQYQRLGAAPIVVWERANGDMEVVTGRHRFDLARRNGEKTIPAQVVREADGFTKERALRLDRDVNIWSGQASAKDYAHIP